MTILNDKIKKWHIVVFAVIVVCFVVLKFFDWFYWPKGQVVVGEKTYQVLIADRLGHQHRGWGGSDDMGKVDGMWFAFGAPSYHSMVMREMKFPLDIVWVKDGFIVDIAPEVRPEPGRTDNQLTVYRSRLPSTDVLEFKSGFAAENGLKIGDEVDFHRY